MREFYFLRSRKERITLKKELSLIFISKYKKYETGKNVIPLHLHYITIIINIITIIIVKTNSEMSNK